MKNHFIASFWITSINFDQFILKLNQFNRFYSHHQGSQFFESCLTNTRYLIILYSWTNIFQKWSRQIGEQWALFLDKWCTQHSLDKYVNWIILYSQHWLWLDNIVILLTFGLKSLYIPICLSNLTKERLCLNLFEQKCSFALIDLNHMWCIGKLLETTHGLFSHPVICR